MSDDDLFSDIEKLRLPPSLLEEVRIGTPTKVLKRREEFVIVPMAWDDRLTGCRGHTYKIAIRLLYLYWRHHYKPFKLPNGMLQYDGVSRYSKYRALAKLEQLGLISIERPPKKSPIIHIYLEPKDA
jgi:hypothetical protein